MHRTLRLGICAATLAAVVSPATILQIATASADTTVALDSALRRCDFSGIGTAPTIPRPGLGTGFVRIHSTGSSAAAEVHLADPDQPGTHFDVGLIEVPRPPSATCGPGDPGTAFTGLDTDGA